MITIDGRSGPIVVANRIALAAAALYLLLTCKAWFGQHLPLPLHPALPPSGTVPRTGCGPRSSVR